MTQNVTRKMREVKGLRNQQCKKVGVVARQDKTWTEMHITG